MHPTQRTPQYIKQTLTDTEEEINSNNVVVGVGVNTPLKPWARSSRKKINKRPQDLK